MGFSPAAPGWEAVDPYGQCHDLTPALSCVPSGSLSDSGKGHETHTSCRGRFVLQDFTGQQFYNFFILNFPLPAQSCSTQL